MVILGKIPFPKMPKNDLTRLGFGRQFLTVGLTETRHECHATWKMTFKTHGIWGVSDFHTQPNLGSLIFWSCLDKPNWSFFGDQS